MSEIIDLDVLKPDEKIIKIGGKKINIGFIPAGITWEIENIQRKAASLDPVKMLEGGEETKKGFDLTLELCSLYCQVKNPDMDVEWFKQNADAKQVRIMADEINKALAQTLKDIGEYSKNEEAGQ